MNFKKSKTRIKIASNYLALLLITAICEISFALPVVIYNDLEKESEGRLIEVDEVETTEIKKIRYRLRIYPGQEKEIARGSVLRFSLSRVFPAHKVKYEVKCPDKGETIRITIQELHENRMGGKCELSRYGHWSRRTGSQWSDVESKSKESKSDNVTNHPETSPEIVNIPW